MSDTKTTVRVAIVGFGPRGLAALEALTTLGINANTRISVDIFDPFPWAGAGPNYDPDQSELCILNVPIRGLDIDPPKITAGQIGAFSDWSSTSYTAEDYPPRSDVGAYFHHRFKELVKAADGTITIKHHKSLATDLERTGAGWSLTSAGENHGPFDEVLLTQGQPETAPDPQLDLWTAHAAKHSLDILPAYPANDLITAAQHWASKTVAIRGLGLSTFDVMRMLTAGMGGTFKDGAYTPSGAEPHKILPFSLNGRPPSPKPASNAVDNSFDPTPAETNLFKQALKAAQSADGENALTIICDGLIDPASRILAELGSDSTRTDVEQWLATERRDPGAQEFLDGLETLKLDIEMAHGRVPPTLGYAIGQVWRKWEGEMRKAFNQGKFGAETSCEIVNFDEGIKRISAGPPVSAAQELLALINCGLVSLCTVDDPAIVLRTNGWQLIEGDDALTASVMIDAVLAAPNVAHVTDQLVTSTVNSGIAQPIKDGRGIVTTQNGQLMDQDNQTRSGLSALGRLALGSVIAVDSLHDCFGDTTTRWAEGVMQRVEQRHANS